MTDPIDPALKDLQEMWQYLPPAHVRWETEPGFEFWLALEAQRENYTLDALARTLSMSISGVRKILDRRIPRVYPWPTDGQADALACAWQQAERARQPTGRLSRSSPQFAALRNVLTPLLERYELRHLAAAIEAPPRALARYAPKPSETPNP
jgi:hypothetical protein